MPRKPKKPPPQAESPKNFDEFNDETEAVDDDVASAESAAAAIAEQLRDWRDVEKYKEELLLRRLIDDDLELDAVAAPPQPKVAAKTHAKRR